MLKPHFEGDISRLQLELELQKLYGRDVVTSVDTGYSHVYSIGEREVGYYREGSGLIPAIGSISA